MGHPNSGSFFSGTIPSYRKPPIDEVVIGIRFNIPDKIGIPHIGLLWDKFRKDYPIIDHAPPIASAKGEIAVDSKTGIPHPRVWFIKQSDDQLIQFQVDRLHFNWRRREADYPRYPNIIQTFEKVHDTVGKFFMEYGLGPLQPIECELTYINHLLKGREWNSTADLPRVFFDFIWEQRDERFLPEPESIAWRAKYPLGGERGVLTVKLDSGTLIKDKTPVFILNLTATGIGESSNKEDIRKWFDLAHEWIVRGFTDLTTPEVQKIWERER